MYNTNFQIIVCLPGGIYQINGLPIWEPWCQTLPKYSGMILNQTGQSAVEIVKIYSYKAVRTMKRGAVVMYTAQFVFLSFTAKLRIHFIQKWSSLTTGISSCGLWRLPYNSGTADQCVKRDSRLFMEKDEVAPSAWTVSHTNVLERLKRSYLISMRPWDLCCITC